MSRLLVTGVSGYLGATLAARASAAGWEVTGTHLTTEPPAGVDARRVDVRDAEALRALVSEVRPGAVVHTAYRQHDADAAAINVAGAAHVAAAAAQAGARLVHLSSDLVFRGGLGRPLREDDPVDPVTGYGRTKAQAEEAVLAAGPGALLVRTSLLYGGGEAPISNHERFALEAARGEREATFFANEIRSPVQVGDLAAALVELLPMDVAGPLHLGGADAVDRHEFACLVARANGVDASLLRAGDSGPGRPADCALDSSRAATLLRTRLRGAREVLRPRP